RLGGVAVDFSSPVPLGWTALSGLMVGIGVSYGGGCTSGHGVCGLARAGRPAGRPLAAAGCWRSRGLIPRNRSESNCICSCLGLDGPVGRSCIGLFLSGDDITGRA
ncbi:hypothetical protein VB636_00030, partial [Paracoccus sp. APAP_BH8]|uniref:YeeE/YedE family protein n=1 Tax=Paracoccus sp. APAP_BH8 TaxID=3110237 RepID=UPI003B2B2408